MSFRFSWKFVNVDELYDNCKQSMTLSIAQSKRPPKLVEPLKVVDLDFGTDPPELEFHSIPAVDETKVHVVFKLKYSGNANVTVQTTVQANPLLEVFEAAPKEWPHFVRPRTLGATSSLILPFKMKLNNVQLDALVDVTYTKQGLVCVFRNNPVKSVSATSSLDSIPGVENMLRELVKASLSDTFNEDVPEAVWKATSPSQRFPDPCTGPRRALQQFIQHKKFLELGMGIKTPIKKPFDTLSVGVKVPHSIPSRVCLRQRERANIDKGAVSVEDLLEDAVPPHATTHTPKRRVISVRKLKTETPTPSPLTPQLGAQDDVPFDSPPLLVRSHSNPDFGPEHRKVRTVSLQPASRPFSSRKK